LLSKYRITKFRPESKPRRENWTAFSILVFFKEKHLPNFFYGASSLKNKKGEEEGNLSISESELLR